MSLRLVFVDDHTAEFRVGERLLARYSAAPDVPVNESPKPCLHPVQTLAGETVTAFRPADHTWHHGIAWAFTYIDGDTFWGGPTFLNPEQGYQWQQNHGHQRHISWETTAAAETDSDHVSLQQRVQWISSTGEIVLNETRWIAARVLDDSTWSLEFKSEFSNATTRALTLQSPVTRGRPSGGYFGLMWRGPASWAQGTLHSPDGSADVMGHAAPWLGYERADARGSAAHLLFVDHPNNPRFPTRWFARCEAEPIASFALAYVEPLSLAPSAQLTLQYAMVCRDRAFSSVDANQLAQSYWRRSTRGT